MAKRRTKKQKEQAKKNHGAIHWEPGNSISEATVKRQFKSSQENTPSASTKTNNANLSAQSAQLTSIKKDIAKSLLFALIIIAAEVMLYFIWQS